MTFSIPSAAADVNQDAHGAAPSPWVQRFLPLVPRGGRVLDLAAGDGRHTLLLLQHGFRVVAADRKTEGLVAGVAGHGGCRIVEIDLEDGGPWRLGGDFDGIIVTRYLHRPLLPALAAALAPGGALIYETFMLGNERFGRPANPDFLLRPNELFEVYARALAVIAFEQGEVGTPAAAVIQRIAAVKAA